MLNPLRLGRVTGGVCFEYIILQKSQNGNFFSNPFSRHKLGTFFSVCVWVKMLACYRLFQN